MPYASRRPVRPGPRSRTRSARTPRPAVTSRTHVAWSASSRLTRVRGPRAVQHGRIEPAGIHDQAVPGHVTLAFGQAPVLDDLARRPDAQLSAHARGTRIAPVVRVIEDGDVSPVVAALDGHPHVRPDRPLLLGLAVALSGCVDHFTRDALAPRHTDEQAADVEPVDG